MFHHAEIIAVGSELLLGNVANTDAQYVSQKLAAVGVDVLYHTVVGDNPERLQQVTDIARQRCDLLIFIGGLGPTYDDLTKDTVCAAFGVATEFHEDVMEEISGYFKNVFRREMPDCNRRQAYLPKGCTVLHNPVGTAPGCVFTADGVTVAMLPGVPHECRYLTDHALLPYLQARQESMILSHTLHVFGLTEPKVQEELGDNAPVLLEETAVEILNSYYPGLENAKLKQSVFFISPTATSCEVSMVEAESAADAEIVRQSFQARVDAMANDTTYPEEAGMWKNNATVTVNGNYVVLEVLPDGCTVPDAFLAKF